MCAHVLPDGALPGATITAATTAPPPQHKHRVCCDVVEVAVTQLVCGSMLPLCGHLTYDDSYACAYGRVEVVFAHSCGCCSWTTGDAGGKSLLARLVDQAGFFWLVLKGELLLQYCN